MSMDWEKWEREQKPELELKIAEFRKARDEMTRPELAPLRAAMDKLIGDLERVIAAGEMERKMEQGGAVPGPDSQQ